MDDYNNPHHAAAAQPPPPSADPSSVWIYHERQQALLCGQHALNNLAQKGVFTADRLATIAHRLDQMELDVFAQNSDGGRMSKDYQDRLREGSHHVDEAGNFSIEVLKAAVQDEFGLLLPHLSQCLQQQQVEITTLQGFLCHKSDHWFAIRLIGGRFWNLNSMLERPQVISHFRLAVDLDQWQSQGYTVFAIPSGLPAGGVKTTSGAAAAISISSSDSEHAVWHRMSDLLQGKSTAADPWEKLNGAGMRLDGRASSANNNNSMSSNMVVEGLTEEEMIQMAMQASMEPPPVQQQLLSKDAPVVVTGPVPAEPPPGTVGSVRIQFKLPDNSKRVVRRFMETDRVSDIYAYVQEKVGQQQRQIELRCGFPPKDLRDIRDSTIQEANLANESIQARFI